MSESVDHSIFENELVIDIGLEIEKVIRTANQATQGLIMACYINFLFSLTVMSFSLVSVLTLNAAYANENRVVVAGMCIFAFLMYLIRLYILMNSGQILLNRIKQSKLSLEDTIMSQETPSKMKKDRCNKLFVLRKRLEVYLFLHPIAPYSVFTLSSKTFYATLATILTYIVVLIKLRGSDTSNTRMDLNVTNVTVSI